MFCSKCGGAVAADSTFCTSCGTPQVHPALANSAAVTVAPNVGVAGYSGTHGTFLYAGFWLRFVAYLIDSLLMGIVIVPLFLILAVMTGAFAHFQLLADVTRRGQVDPAALAALLSLFFIFVGISILITWLYHAYCESSEWQATPGKRVMNLYVSDLSGHRISFLNATGRHFSKIITGLIPLAIGYIMAGFTDRRQALHDMIASTLVLRR